MSINPFQNAFGLDFGDRSIKILQLHSYHTLSKKNKYKLTHASQFDLPEGLIVNGEIQQPEEVVKLLKKHLKDKAPKLLRSPWAVVCLPETKTYIQLINVPVDPASNKITQEKIQEIAPSYLPYDLNNVYMDWQDLGVSSSKKTDRQVLFAAAPKQIIDSYTFLLNIAGIIPLAFEVEAMSIARAVINRKKDLHGQARGILDFGATRSSLVIIDHDIIQFSLSLPISGLKITQNIQTAMAIEFFEAEKIKKECGIENRKCQGKLKQILEKTLEELTDKILQAMQFYKLHFPNKNPLTGIRLCGGGANLPALESYLSAKLKLRVRRANPWVNLYPSGKEPLSEADSLAYTTAIGLAMRALEKPIVL